MAPQPRMVPDATNEAAFAAALAAVEAREQTRREAQVSSVWVLACVVYIEFRASSSLRSLSSLGSLCIRTVHDIMLNDVT